MGLSDKTIRDLVYYYYRWKKSFRHVQWKSAQLLVETPTTLNSLLSACSEQTVSHPKGRHSITSSYSDEENEMLLPTPPSTTESEETNPELVRDIKRRRIIEPKGYLNNDPLQGDNNTTTMNENINFWDENGLEILVQDNSGIYHDNDDYLSPILINSQKSRYPLSVQNPKDNNHPNTTENDASIESDFISDLFNTSNNDFSVFPS